MSIRSAAGSRAGRRPISVHHAVAPRSPSFASYLSSRSRPESIYLEPIYAEPHDDDLESYSSGSSDGDSGIREEHHSTGPRTSTHLPPHDGSEGIRSHMQDLEEDVVDTRQEWGDGEINPPDMMLRIANHKRGLAMIASSDACKEPSLKLKVEGVDDVLKKLEAEANIRKAREREELQDLARKETERRENKRIEELGRRKDLMREKAAEKERIRIEKEAKKKEKAEEEKQKRLLKEKKRKDHNAKFAAAMKESERLAKEEKKRKEQQRISEGKNAYETRKRREKAARDRDIRRETADKRAREAEEQARYLKDVAEEEKRYEAKKTHQKKAKVALGGREEESRKRERERAEAFAKKVRNDRDKKLNREWGRLEDKIKLIKDKLNCNGDE